MNTNLDFIKESLKDMAIVKFDNMLGSEISKHVYDLINGKEDIVAESAYELIKNNDVVYRNRYMTIRAMDGLNYELIQDWYIYDEFENLDDIDDETINNCSEETMNQITYDALYNYDVLWIMAITKSFTDCKLS